MGPSASFICNFPGKSIFIAITRSSLHFGGVFAKHRHVSVHKIGSLECFHVKIIQIF